MKTVATLQTKSEIDSENVTYIFEDIQYYKPLAFDNYKSSVVKRAQAVSPIFNNKTPEDVKVKTYQGIYYHE
jgi:hypothetical protein